MLAELPPLSPARALYMLSLFSPPLGLRDRTRRRLTQRRGDRLAGAAEGARGGRAAARRGAARGAGATARGDGGCREGGGCIRCRCWPAAQSWRRSRTRAL
eukprot:1663396-Rhodomonas_salina.2